MQLAGMTEYGVVTNVVTHLPKPPPTKRGLSGFVDDHPVLSYVAIGGVLYYFLLRRKRR